MSEFAEDGTGHGRIVMHNDLASAVAERERSGDVRWVWAACGDVYPALLRAGVRVQRCHDVALTEALLLAREGRQGEPASLGRGLGRLHGAVAPAAQAAAVRPAAVGQAVLFEPADPAFPSSHAALEALVAVHADQLRRIAADEHPGRFALLAAAESAAGLVAAEMGFYGLPWRTDVHSELLTSLLGDKPLPGLRPPRLADLATRFSAALGGRPVNPDSPAQVLRALAADGVRISSTRAHVLREVDHPAAALLLEYKELARLHAAHGWSWLDEWVTDGRFRPEYVVGGVVSGRWASRGGGALQIPRVLRRAVVADAGWVLVVADAAQLEPRVLAALAEDEALATAAGTGDLYQALADAFDGERGNAKIALLSAMYGGRRGRRGNSWRCSGTGSRWPPSTWNWPPGRGRRARSSARGSAGPARRRRATGAASPPSPTTRAPRIARGPVGARPRQVHPQLRGPGKRGRLGRCVPGRAAAPPGAFFAAIRNGRGSRHRLRRAVRGRRRGALRPELVFFQHDEVIVHCPEDLAGDVVSAVGEAAAEAGRLVFGPTPVGSRSPQPW